MKKAATVDEYIENAPIDVQEKLRNIRTAIKEVAPESLERISYAMPYYEYKGRLAYFAYAKNHIGLYIPPPIIENYKKELTEYVTSKSAVQFPLNRELPISLLKRLVKARVDWNNKIK